MLNDQRGQISFFLVFIYMMTILIIIFALFIPMNEVFLIKSYALSESMLDDATDSINTINDAEMKSAINSSLTAQKDSISGQVDILGTFFQYSWLIIAIVIVLIMFIVVRQRVETEAVI